MEDRARLHLYIVGRPQGNTEAAMGFCHYLHRLSATVGGRGGDVSAFLDHQEKKDNQDNKEEKKEKEKNGWTIESEGPPPADVILCVGALGPRATTTTRARRTRDIRHVEDQEDEEEAVATVEDLLEEEEEEAEEEEEEEREKEIWETNAVAEVMRNWSLQEKQEYSFTSSSSSSSASSSSSSSPWIFRSSMLASLFRTMTMFTEASAASSSSPAPPPSDSPPSAPAASSTPSHKLRPNKTSARNAPSSENDIAEGIALGECAYTLSLFEAFCHHVLYLPGATDPAALFSLNREPLATPILGTTCVNVNYQVVEPFDGLAVSGISRHPKYSCMANTTDALRYTMSCTGEENPLAEMTSMIVLSSFLPRQRWRFHKDPSSLQKELKKNNLDDLPVDALDGRRILFYVAEPRGVDEWGINVEGNRVTINPGHFAEHRFALVTLERDTGSPTPSELSWSVQRVEFHQVQTLSEPVISKVFERQPSDSEDSESRS